MNDILMCPSMMCANYGKLEDEVIKLDEAGIDIFHCDVMDGSFVPNIAMGIMDIDTIRKKTNKILDCHLMIENPSNKIDWFINVGVDLIYIHPESERYVIKTLSYIKETSIESIIEMLSLCDYVLVMTVNPGFAGQKFIEFTKKKISKLVDLKKLYSFKIIIDGACSPSVIKELTELGCDGFVLGTSSLFNKEKNYKQIIHELRNL